MSEEYLKWVKETNQSNLTNTQAKFAEWLLLPENIKVVGQLANLDDVFISITRWLKK